MANHIGTPLQAIKFALTMRQVDAQAFLEDWSEGLRECWENAKAEVYDELWFAAHPDHAEHVAADGSVRKAYYGDGEQPWDIIKRLAWAPYFAAGNALKYIRRVKGEPDDHTKARWYWTELKKLCTDSDHIQSRNARAVMAQLLRELKQGELDLLDGGNDA